MSQKLCRECGHPLPNAAGPGLYCTFCGTPVNPNEKAHTGHFMTTHGRCEVAVHTMSDSGVVVAEVVRPTISGVGKVYFAGRDAVTLIGQAVTVTLDVSLPDSKTCYSFNSMRDAVEQYLASELADQMSDFMVRGKPHE